MTRVLIPVADGTEEMEAVIVADTLRRAKWEVVIAGLKEGPITASRGVRIIPDSTMDRVLPGAFDAIVIPGGGAGVANLAKDERVLNAVRTLHQAGKLVAAVCAGPLLLQAAGILDGRRATCHPAVAERLTRATRLDDAVVEDGNVITSRGPGTSIRFALKIIERVDGAATAAEVARAMVAA